jgi:uncharacterized membrane protein (DUF2068 family)
MLKAVVLVVISFVLSPKNSASLLAWVVDAQLGPHNWLITYILHSIETGLGYPPHTLHLVRICVIIYAGLYVVEGVGLILEKKWAEWVVIVATVASLPVEIVDFVRRPSWMVLVLFLLNLLMAAYLAWRLHRQAAIKRERMTMME